MLQTTRNANDNGRAAPPGFVAVDRANESWEKLKRNYTHIHTYIVGT